MSDNHFSLFHTGYCVFTLLQKSVPSHNKGELVLVSLLPAARPQHTVVFVADSDIRVIWNTICGFYVHEKEYR